MSQLGEERRYPRQAVEYPAEIWIRRGEEARGTFVDCGVRGVLRDISLSGVGMDDIRSFNVRGWGWRSFLTEKSMLKILVHTSRSRVELWGSIVWVQEQNQKGRIGIRLISISQEDLKSLTPSTLGN
ncbi:MAG: PilZ domain-containing protein [Deltaproteobacteria bacterium]|nr:PilZ domain-containing protein [Deltaproteobacteria bacterium]